jgi:hypothetical protein
MAFERAEIPVVNATSFEMLKGAIDDAFRKDLVGRTLKSLDSADVQIRNVEKVIADHLRSERLNGTAAWALYSELSLSDQGQIREYYLTKVEELHPELRRKYKKLFRYS